MQHPIYAIFKMIEWMEQQAALTLKGIEVAHKRRDILLIKMMISNPLRVHHYSRMTYHKDNSGNLYRGSNGDWRLRFSPEDFKNHTGAAKSEYDVSLSAWLYVDIENYISTYRPVITRGEDTDFFFLPRFWSKKTTDGELFWNSYRLSKKIFTLTKYFIPACPGFSAHAFRHIVATDFIKNNPNGFQVAASILHDKLETVMREYAHIKVADGFSHWTSYFDSQVEAVKGASHE